MARGTAGERRSSSQKKGRSGLASPPGGAESWGDWVIDLLPPPIGGIVDRMRHDDILLHSSGLAFYALVSVAPTIILIMWIASLVVGDSGVQQMATEMKKTLPSSLGADTLFQQVANVGNSVGFIAILTALWPATSYGSGMRRSLNNLGPNREENMPGMKGRGLILVFVFPFLVIGGVVVALLITGLTGTSAFGRVAGVIAALIGGFLLSGGSIAIMYRVFPRARLSWKAIWSGTLVAGVAISVLSLAFAAYLSYGADFQAHYATSGVAAVVLFAVWLFLSNALVLVGFKAALEAD